MMTPRSPGGAARQRTEEEYRELIGIAVFWLSRWPHGPESQPRLPEDLAKLAEIVDEDAAAAHEELLAEMNRMLSAKLLADEPPTDGRTSSEGGQR